MHKNERCVHTDRGWGAHNLDGNGMRSRSEVKTKLFGKSCVGNFRRIAAIFHFEC